MGKRNTLTDFEASIVKALIARDEFSNQAIAGLINRARGAAASDISTGRISNIKNNQIKKYAAVPAASAQALNDFLAPKATPAQVILDPLSDVELGKLIRQKDGAPGFLDITETDRIECKKSYNLMMKTIAAFANNKGGYFLFGVENKTWEVHGTDAKKFAELDFNKVNQNILNSLGIGLEIQKRGVNFNGKTIGVLYVGPAHTKPVIMSQAGDGFSQGQIYFRYPGEDRLITRADLQRLIEDRIRQLSETVLSKHISNILKFGIENSAVMDLSSGMVDGKAGNFVIDPTLLPRLSFIKEGEFVETSGAPTLKLIGEVAPSAVVIANPQKLTELYPYSYTDLSKRVKKLRPGTLEQAIQKVIREHNMKQDAEFSAYNFRNKREEDRYAKLKKITGNVPSIYNEAAVEHIIETIGPA